MELINGKIHHILMLYKFGAVDLGKATLAVKELFNYKDLQPLEVREKEFSEALRPYVDKYGAEMIFEFFNHWKQVTQRGRNKGLMKFEICEQDGTFNIPGRLATWKKNQQKFSIANLINKTAKQK